MPVGLCTGICSAVAAFFSHIHSSIEPVILQICATKLAFNDGGTFKILQLADLHYGHFPEVDESTLTRHVSLSCRDID